MSDLDAIVEGALYTEIKQLKDGKSIVMDPTTERLYYKKVLSVFSVPVYRYLKNHPNKAIPGIKVFWKEEGNLVVIEEMIQGTTLDELLDSEKDYRGNPLSFEEKKRILLAICDGLIFLHASTPPIIHRDIKASNVMVADDGSVKIIDYDAAKQYIRGKEKDTVLIGTQGSAAPEQYGFAQSDERTDIYGFGKLIQRVMPESPQAMRIAAKATKLQPELRYNSVSQMRFLIDKLWDPAIPASTRSKNAAKKVVHSLAFKIAVPILCVAILLLTAGYIFNKYYYHDIYVNEPAYKEGVAAMQSEDYETAMKKFDVCGTEYKDVETLYKTCKVESVKDGLVADYEKALAKYESNSSTTNAVAVFDAAKVLKSNGVDKGEAYDTFYESLTNEMDACFDSEDYNKVRLIAAALESQSDEDMSYINDEIEYRKGMAAFEEGDYVSCVNALKTIDEYKDSKDKVAEAKYLYCKQTINDPDENTRYYLFDLNRDGYAGIDTMVLEICKWRASKIHITKANYLETSFTITGGPLAGMEGDRTTTVRAEIVAWNGTTWTTEYPAEVYSDKKIVFNFGKMSTFPSSGSFTLNVYDGYGNLIGSKDDTFN